MKTQYNLVTQWIAARKARKLCCQCGKRPLATKNHCRPCADANTARNLARYYTKKAAVRDGGEQ